MSAAPGPQRPRRSLAPAALARVLVALKLRLLRNTLRRSPWQVVGLALGLLYGLGLTVALVAGLVALRGAGPDVAGAVVVLGGSALVAAWALVPLVAFGTDATLDPARLVPYPAPASALVPGLALAGLVGVPGLVTTLVAAATVVTWSRGPLVALVAALGAAVAVASAVSLSRLTTSAFAGLLGGRRSRERVTVVMLLVVSLVGPGFALLSGGWSGRSGVVVEPERLRQVADVLAWTPLGWAWAAPAAVAGGDVGSGVLRLLLAALLLLAVLAAWSRVLARSLAGGGLTPAPGGEIADDASRHGDPGSGRGRRGDRTESALLARLEGTRTGAVTARSLRYWRRDSRYLTTVVSMLGVPLVVLVVATSLPVPADVVVLALGPVFGFFLGWASHDDVAYDGTAVWMVVAAGLPGRADRLGRSFALLVWGLPLVVAASVVGAGVSGRWEMLPATAGVALALLGAGQGVSAVSSVATPYPVPEPGASPFAAPPGSAVASVVVQLVSSVVGVCVASPAIALAVAALVLGPPGAPGALSLGALAAGLVVGTGAWLLGVHLGARLLERRGPKLLSTLVR